MVVGIILCDYSIEFRVNRVLQAVDILTPEQRSERMRRVRQKDTAPELAVRKTLHKMGYRYRLHRRDLPGSPDIVFPSRRKVIFVHGCFWHGHQDPKCKLSRLPKSKKDFWRKKFSDNRDRDRRKIQDLKIAGWECLVLWQCQIGNLKSILKKLEIFLK